MRIYFVGLCGPRVKLYHICPKKPAWGFWSCRLARRARVLGSLARFWFMRPSKVGPEPRRREGPAGVGLFALSLSMLMILGMVEDEV